MKTKLSILLAVIFILITLLTSCGDIPTTQSTTASSCNISPTPMRTSFYSMEEFLAYMNDPEKIHDRDKETYKKIRENGKIYYAEIKFDEYLLYDIIIDPDRPTYSSFPKDAYTGNEEDLVYATDEVLMFTPEYASIFEDKKSQLLQFFKDYDFELLDNGSIYSEKLKWLIFEYDGCVFQINLPQNYEGSLDWQDIVEIKYVEVNK